MPDTSDTAHRAEEAFQRQYSTEPDMIVTAPGRVNLLGEHTDYNDGWVMPMALHLTTAVAAGVGDGGWLEAISESESEPLIADISNLEPEKDSGWVNYVAGAVRESSIDGKPATSVRLAICSDIPQGAGLSSSASLEVAVASACTGLWNLDYPALDMAKRCQRAENIFADVPCGIMDQAIAVLGRKGHALLLDCRSMEYEHMPLPDSHVVIIFDTGISRKLSGSAYQERREQCASGVEQLSAATGVALTSLRDVEPDLLEKYGSNLDDVIRARCRHVISENGRVVSGADALRLGDINRFGELMSESHESLRDDYQVSSLALDTIVDVALEQPGCVGARMTGAGFGGCAIALVTAESAESVADGVMELYRETSGNEGNFYFATPSDGAHILNADGDLRDLT